MSPLTLTFLVGFIGIAFIYTVYSLNLLIKNGQVPLEKPTLIDHSKVNPAPKPSMDARLVFGCTAMVRDFIPWGNGEIHITHWMGPVDIIGYDNSKKLYMTSVGEFCDARPLTEEEKTKHARNWAHALKIVEEH